MFLAASLNPNYFATKINVFIAMAPVASTEHLAIKPLRAAANRIRILEFLMTRIFSFYDWFPHMALESEAVDTFCLFESELCLNILSELFDPEIDNLERFEMGVGDFPSGQTYRAMVYYAQSIRGDYRFSQYSFGTIGNLLYYGSVNPPEVPLEKYKVPTVMMSGDRDKFATPEDVAWITE